MRWLASGIAVSCAALVCTLPLQLLHFGSTPLYALVANLLAAPLLAPLTLSAMGLAVMALVLPHPLLVVLAWPVQQLAGLLIALVHWISHWPAAQLLTGHPQPWVVFLMVVGLIPWLITPLRRLRGVGVVALVSAVVLHGVVQLGDGVCWPRLRRFGLYGVRLVLDQVDGQEHGWVFVPQQISNVGCVVIRRKTPWGWTSRIVGRLFDVMERWQSPVDRARLEIV